MKKVSKFLLRENVEVLQKDEMKFILGGSTYKCCCGQGECNSFYINAESYNDALSEISDRCGVYGTGGCY